jgi:hypothetical protein
VIPLALAAWLLLALAAGAAGLVAAVGPPFPQALLAGLTLLLLGLFARAPAVRAWALGIDIRALVLVHVTRFVGFYFLVLHGRGELPWAFAVPGGWGDIVVAATALAVAAAAPRQGAAGWRVYAAWNLVGLADILGVVATAVRLALADPASMRALTRLPLSLLPTFLVPLIIATHVIVFARLAASRRGAYRPF